MLKKITGLIQNEFLSQIILSLLWIFMFVFTDSFKDVPLNDDWVYGKSVELLVQEGEFKLLDKKYLFI